MCNIDGPCAPVQVIKGTLEDDVLLISKAQGADGLRGLYEVSFNGRVRLMTEEQLKNTRFELRDGNDMLLVAPDVTVGIEADGGAGNDIMMGGRGDDRFGGGAGSDVLMGGHGRDTLWGGFDKDVDVLDAGANEPLEQHGGMRWRPIDSIYTRDGDKVKNAGDDIVTNLDELDREKARWDTSQKL